MRDVEGCFFSRRAAGSQSRRGSDAFRRMFCVFCLVVKKTRKMNRTAMRLIEVP